jgi:hypothetical protein
LQNNSLGKSHDPLIKKDGFEAFSLEIFVIPEDIIQHHDELLKINSGQFRRSIVMSKKDRFEIV